MKSFSLFLFFWLPFALAQGSSYPPPQKQPSSGMDRPLTQCALGCSTPAAIGVKRKAHPLNASFFINSSFTYWFAGEEGLSIAEKGALNSQVLYFTDRTPTFFQSSDYKLGFKAGIGMIRENKSVLHLEYTWFRGKNTSSSSSLSGTVPAGGTSSVTTGSYVWVVNDWFLQGSAAGQSLAGSQISSQWKLHLDLIDATGSYPFYQAPHMIICPFGGLRAALIRQSMDVKLTESSLLFGGAIPAQPIGSRNHSHSWAIGPRVGVEGQYLLSRGFRFEGNVAGSLLYTRYHVKHSEDVAATTFVAGPYTTDYDGYNCLRPVGELGLGMGWGRYCRNRDFHLDFSVDYDFLLFWSQNMMRKMLDDTLTGTSPAASDLYLHGLTLTGRFDF